MSLELAAVLPLQPVQQWPVLGLGLVLVQPQPLLVEPQLAQQPQVLLQLSALAQ